MFVAVAWLALVLPPAQEGALGSAGQEPAPDEIARVLDEAESALERAQAAQEVGDPATARAETDRVVELLAPLPLVDGSERTVEALWHAGYLAYVTGNLACACKAMNLVVDHRERTLPTGHPDLLAARQNLAVTMLKMGDLPGARAVQEAVLEAAERTLPTDHPELLAARQNLAVTMAEMGDLAGARALFDAVIAGTERALSADHPDLLAARLNLAATIAKMGDLSGARALEEAVVEARERTLPVDHPDLLAARQNLAVTIKDMGNLSGARALFEAVITGYERTLPTDHPALLLARLNLAVTMLKMGDLAGARVLFEAVVEARERTLPADHPDLLAARQNLAGMMAEMGDLAGARALGLEIARGMLRRLDLVSLLSSREAREAVGAEAHRSSWIRFSTDSGGSEDAEPIRFALAETLRAVASGRQGDDDPRRQEISAVRARLNDLVSGGPGQGQPSEAFAAELSRLTFERDRLEREIRGDLAEKGVVSSAILAADVAKALPRGATALGYLRHLKWELDPTSSTSISSAGDVLAAHVLFPDGSLVELELGAAEELVELVQQWRASIGEPRAAVARGSFGQRDSRGVAAETVDEVHESDRPNALEAGQVLRERVLDPILELLGEETTTLFVCLDDFLHMVPIDALPLEEGRVGDHYRVVNDVSFARLVSTRSPPAGKPSLLALGGVQFEGGIDSDADSSGSKARKSANRGLFGARLEVFEPLPQTGVEVEEVSALFEKELGEDVVLLTSAEATKMALHEHAAGKLYLHIATHGWFAPETVPSTLDTPLGDALWSPMGAKEVVTGLAPMTLCGLALAGANQGRDSLGRVPGILTAEELAGIDLSSCELAVLSACETNVGIRRAGQGIQSLQTALHAAGVRTAITSLWKVDDTWTRELMTEFYRLIWVEEKPKAEALWEAKMAIRERGAGLVDWAGWVLTGDPD